MAILPSQRVEWFRQGWHLGLSALLALVWLVLGAKVAIGLCFALLMVGGLLSWLIMRNFKIPFFSHHVWSASRSHEKKIPGEPAFILILSILFTFVLFLPFNPLVAFAGVFSLALLDSFSAIIGQLFGRHTIFPGKTLEGTTGGFVVAWIGLLFFFSPLNALLLALVAAVAELLPLNDNVSIPLSCSVAALILTSVAL